MKKSIYIASFALSIVFSACGGGEKTTTDAPQEPPKSMIEEKAAYDATKGEGKFTAEALAISDKLDAAMAKTGEDATNVKCASCHKMTDEKLVGPGWKDVTKRRKPEWIMNFITNPDPMIDKDPAVQAMLETCLVRMPNQSLSDTDARNILEFMRKNDGVK